MNGHAAKHIGQPGRIKFTIATHASVSATVWTNVPASVAGAVAPACGGTAKSTVSPNFAVSMRISIFSRPIRNGETIGHPPKITDGFFINEPSPPEARSKRRIACGM